MIFDIYFFYFKQIETGKQIIIDLRFEQFGYLFCFGNFKSYLRYSSEKVQILSNRE